AILDAVHQFAIDSRGVMPATITAVPTVMGNGVGLIDVCADLVPTYITAMPFDPTDANGAYTSCAAYNTGYQISVDADGRVTVAAPTAELDETISVTR
ncbi:MAG: hypothetical protein WCX95_04880, partial [Candidatus Gracilibacteria bacterium]